MFSFLDVLLPPQIIVLDLAAGAGSISQRLLRRRPEARNVAVDIDPVMLAIGQGALGDMQGRLRWVRADLRDPGWAAALGGDGFDVVLSATATHWLQPAELAAVYRDVAGLLRPGGVLLNGDIFPPERGRISPSQSHPRQSPPTLAFHEATSSKPASKRSEQSGKTSTRAQHRLESLRHPHQRGLVGACTATEST